MDGPASNEDTLKALEEVLAKAAFDVKRLEQTIKGLESKLAQAKAQHEMAAKMVEIARGAQKKKGTE
jgi:phage shock protein A